MSPEPFNHIVIIGAGLLGASAGLAVKRRWPGARVVGVGRRQSSLDEAINVGAVDETSLDPPAACARADLVILATPVGAFAPILRQVASSLNDSVVITDVGSTKARVVAEAEKILEGKAGRFVGSHPMAGSEKKGPSHASPDLYRGALCILTPTDRTDSQALQQVASLWEAVGMRLLTLAPEAHDQAVAAVSHVPHALASLLMTLPEDDHLPVAATGFADMTRLAAGDPEMWRDIFATNRQAVLTVGRRFARQLGEVEKLVEAGDPEAGEAFLQQAKDRRDAMPLPRRDLPAGDE